MAPVIETGVQSFINARIVEFTRSQRFQDVWTEANRRVHARLVALSPAVDRIRTALQERGLTRSSAAIRSGVDGRVRLVQSEGLVSA